MTYISASVVISTLLAIIFIWSLIELIIQRKKEKTLESQNG